MTALRLSAYLILWLTCGVAFACGCSKPDSPGEVHSFVHMFKGRVVEVTTRNVPEFRYKTQQVVTFAVLRVIDGPPVSTVTVEFGGATSCDLENPDFRVGQIYRISDHDIYLASEQSPTRLPGESLRPSGRYFGNYCSLRELVDDVRKSPIPPASGR